MLPTIAKECSKFLNTCDGNLIVKNLPRTYEGFCKVKVRFGKRKTKFSESFNNAFKDNKHELHKRAIFAYTSKSLLNKSLTEEPFYIFPINGFNFIYNPQVTNSTENFSKLNLQGDLITELLKLSYKGDRLVEALSSQCEIIIYNIPYYYAIRASLLDSCEDILL